MMLDDSDRRAALSDPSATFALIAERVYAHGTFTEVYQAICETAVAALGPVHHASLMICANGRFSTAAATDDVARRIDAAEREIGSGPCHDAIVDEVPQLDADLTDGSTWPALAAFVLEHTPVRGMAGFRMVVDRRKVGALNLFSDNAGELSTCLPQATMLAAFASVALAAVAGHEEAAGLRRGLLSNREIGKAVGLLMAFHKISDDEAFEMLRKASQDMNVKLAEVAREVVDHHNHG
jgi:hypothetical protein